MYLWRCLALVLMLAVVVPGAICSWDAYTIGKEEDEGVSTSFDDSRLRTTDLLHERSGKILDSLDPFCSLDGREICEQIERSCKTRKRSEEPPEPSLLVITCMDNRIDLDRLGIPDGSAYVVRVAGGIPCSDSIAQSLELPFEAALKSPEKEYHGIKVVLFLAHTDCGQQRICQTVDHTHDSALEDRFNEICHDRLTAQYVRDWILVHDTLKRRVSEGALTVGFGTIDTKELRLVEDLHIFSPHEFAR